MNPQLSPFEIITKILSSGQPIVAKEIAKLARVEGFDWTRENANSALYKMLKNSLVIKIETEKAPLWTLPQFYDQSLIDSQPTPKNIIKFKPKRLPLTANHNLTIKIHSLEIQFQFNEHLSSNDPYMSGDWLDEKIFVTLNPNHPFWQTFVNDDNLQSLQLTNIATEVYVQWHVAKMTKEVNPRTLLELRDKALRDISLSE
jgi:hypothetical protein